MGQNRSILVIPDTIYRCCLASTINKLGRSATFIVGKSCLAFGTGSLLSGFGLKQALQVALQDRRVGGRDAIGVDGRSQRVEEGEVQGDDPEDVEATLETKVRLAGRLERCHPAKG
ncbi:hypothetical protein, partial [Arthrobacter citreus]|uniref:hypothetical protein n=1 Tax=Arthrobacter citreus TaxID=1670 RepID=UPI003670B23C